MFHSRKINEVSGEKTESEAALNRGHPRLDETLLSVLEQPGQLTDSHAVEIKQYQMDGTGH